MAGNDHTFYVFSFSNFTYSSSLSSGTTSDVLGKTAPSNLDLSRNSYVYNYTPQNGTKSAITVQDTGVKTGTLDGADADQSIINAGTSGLATGNVQVYDYYTVTFTSGSQTHTANIYRLDTQNPGNYNTLVMNKATQDWLATHSNITMKLDSVSGGHPPGPDYNTLCFSADALIETDRGPIAAGELLAGDLVRTRDGGYQPVRWKGSRDYDSFALTAAPHLRPIRIKAGALGGGMPVGDLLVSPQHRILVRSKIAQKMFGTNEVLVAAKQLCQLDGIDIADDVDSVTYVHFMFDEHQIVYSNGAETESLFTGPEALKAVGPDAREEIFSIFPDLLEAGEVPSARPIAQGKMARKLAERHMQNQKPLLM